MADAEIDYWDDVKKLETEVGAPAGFFFELRKDSDWSFVIKLYALLEGALSHLLHAAVGKADLNPLLSKMNIGGQFGKLEIAKALKVVGPDEVALISTLAKIRNACIHDVSKVTFTFKDYVAALDANAKKELVKAFEGFLVAEIEIAKGKKYPRETVVLNQTKFSLWLGAVMVLSSIYNHKELAKSRADYNAWVVKHHEKNAGKVSLADLLGEGMLGKGADELLSEKKKTL